MTDTAPVVETRTGKVRGQWNTPSSAAFLSIPYAEPPVGDLRFAAPRPRQRWDGVREATAYGPTAQRHQLAEVTAIPEPSIPGDDYLSVNVFTPAPGSRKARLPVLVWIHGGGFTAGSPASPWYDGRAFNRDGVVTVSIGYRLGFIGFGHVDGGVENRGVLDWICALEWVQENIAEFGGDPGNVTIAGQSAGGAASLILLGCERAQGLFSKAIAQSAPEAILPMDFARATASRIAAECGVEPTAADLAQVDEETLFAAQQKVTSAALKGNPLNLLRLLIGQQPGIMPICPVADGDLLSEKIVQALGRGVGKDKPLLTGSTANEFNQISGMIPKFANIIPLAGLLRRAGMDRAAVKEYVASYPKMPSMNLLGQFLTDISFHVPLIENCTAHPDSWVYLFTWRSPAQHEQSPHCLELPFVFDCLDREGVSAQTGPNPPQSLADEMHATWVRFITSGDPGWKRFGDDGAARAFDDPIRTVRGALPHSRILAGTRTV